MKSGCRKILRWSGNGRLDALDHQLVERAPHGREGLGPRGGVDDQLAEERVVVGRDDVADLDVGVPPDAGPAGNSQSR